MIRVPFHLAVLLLGGLSAVSAAAPAAVSLDYKYDANGNLIQGDGKYYEYNDANRLVRVRHRDASGAVIAEYTYDAAGIRAKKTTGEEISYYVAKHAEKEVKNHSESDRNHYFMGESRVASASPLDQRTYYHGNHLGSTYAESDPERNATTRIVYSPFGKIINTPTAQYTFSGKEYDTTTGQYYFQQREYNPELRHFTQADSIVQDLLNPQNINRYSYVLNNPIRYTDPSGQQSNSFNDFWNWATAWYKRQSGRPAEPTLSEATDTSSQESSTSGDGASGTAGQCSDSCFPIAPRYDSFDAYASKIGTTRRDSRYHKSEYPVDVSAPLGTSVDAYWPGVVTETGTSDTWGNYVVVTVADGAKQRYAHLQRIEATMGQQVVPFESQIGTVGNTGNVLKSNGSKPTEAELKAGKGSHLHFEVRDGDGHLTKP